MLSEAVRSCLAALLWWTSAAESLKEEARSLFISLNREFAFSLSFDCETVKRSETNDLSCLSVLSKL